MDPEVDLQGIKKLMQISVHRSVFVPWLPVILNPGPGEAIVRTPGTQGFNTALLVARKPTHFMLNIVIPCYILASLVCISYLLDSGSGERIGYLITIQVSRWHRFFPSKFQFVKNRFSRKGRIEMPL